MLSLCEMFFYTFAHFGETTPKSELSSPEDMKWPVMKDSNILIRKENIKHYNSEEQS